MSLADYIIDDIKKGMNNTEIVKHIHSLEKYADMTNDTLITVINTFRTDK